MLMSMLTPAFALSCIWGVHATNIPDGAVVPTNTQILFAHTFDAGSDLGITVHDTDGEAVPGTMDVQHTHARFIPAAPLLPGAHSIDTDEGYALATFTVVDETDDTPPAAPQIIRVERTASSSEWGRSEGISIEVSEDPDAGHYVYQIAEDSTFSDPIEVVAPSTWTFVGRGLCEETAADYRGRARYHVRVRAVDVAGNASAWSTSPTVARGCSTGTFGGSMLVMGLAGVLVRRRAL